MNVNPDLREELRLSVLENVLKIRALAGIVDPVKLVQPESWPSG